MEWIVNLVREPSCLQAVILICLICAVGLSLGDIKVKGVSLGTAFVFFAGIFFGDITNRLGIDTDRQMIGFAQNFGLILFVYSLGVQVGPAFFPSLKKGGIKLNLFGILTLVLTTLFAIGAFAIWKSVSFTDAMGLLSGAATNTPMLGAATQTLLDMKPDAVDQANTMATACAVSYPFGVLGVLACMIFFRAISKGKEEPRDNSIDDTYVAEFHISNPAVFDRTIGSLSELIDKQIIISRVWKDGQVIIPSSDTVLKKDEHILAVLKKEDLTAFRILFGEKESTDWNRPDVDWNHIDNSNLVSKHLLVTKKELNGVKIGSLHLRNSLDLNITRVNRAGIKLVAYPGLRLQLGDRLTVVGTEASIKKAGEILGNEEKVLHAPNLVALFVGVLLGVLLGAIPIFIPGLSMPVKLGVAGGPIIVGILMGAYGPRFHLSTYTTRSANLMIRQIGIVIYLACLGYGAGGNFVEVVFSSRGLLWIAIALVLATVPVIIAGLFAKKLGKLDYAQTAGMLCAAMANPIALTYANSTSNEEEASEAYATVYPLSMFLRVIIVQLLLPLFIH